MRNQKEKEAKRREQSEKDNNGRNRNAEKNMLNMLKCFPQIGAQVGQEGITLNSHEADSTFAYSKFMCRETESTK